jgi:hypothetical protein
MSAVSLRELAESLMQGHNAIRRLSRIESASQSYHYRVADAYKDGYKESGPAVAKIKAQYIEEIEAILSE